MRRSYIPWSLLVGVVLGFGTNLVTANPTQWWGPLQPLSRYAPVWFPASVAAVLGWGVFRSWHARRRVRWRRSDSPYTGLAAFTSDRASVFFGRDTETRELVDRLSRSGADPRLRIVPLVGPSGCGKSSLINAGVVPQLSSRWQVLGPIRPGASPFTALAAALIATATGVEPSTPPRVVDIQECARLLRDDADQLATRDMNTRAGWRPTGLLAQLMTAQSDSRHLLLIIDQWEELVTQAPAPERSRFMTLLYGGLAAHRSLHVLAALRPEFWQDFLTCAPDHRVGRACPLGPLEPRLVRQAIVRPAEAAGIEFEPGLVDDMVTEATGGDALPLLGHLLQRLSDDAGDDRRITRDAYERAGRVVGAIAEHAEEVYVRLVDIEGTEAVDQTLLLFVSWEGREPARHAIAVADLDDAGQRVAREFQDARLIVEDSDGAVLDLAHEALIRRWDRLRNLATANRERLRQRTAVDRRAQAWWASGCPDDEVLRGRALEDAEQLFTNSGVSHTTRQFITASRAHQRADLDRRADQAAERAQHLRHHDSGLAIALAQAAVHELAPSRKAVLTLWGLVSAPKVVRLPLGHSDTVKAMVWSPDSANLTSVGADGTMSRWDRNGRLLHTSSLPGKATGALLSPDAACLITIEDDQTVIWNATDGTHIASARGPSSLSTDGFAWSQDSRKLACQLGYTDIDIWTITTDDPISVDRECTIDAPNLTSLEWSPDQTMLAQVTIDSVTVIDVDKPHTPLSTTRISFARSCAWSPDSTRVALIDRDGNLLIVTPRCTDEPILRAIAAEGPITWSPDGSLLSTARRSKLKYAPLDLAETVATALTVTDQEAWRKSRNTNTIDVWDAATGDLTRQHDCWEEATFLAWSPDGSCISFTDGHRGQVTFWDLTTDHTATTVGGSITEIAWSPDHASAAAILEHRSPVRITDGDSIETSTYPDPPNCDFTHVMWSPDGTKIAAIDGDTIEISDSASRTNQSHITTPGGKIDGMSWSPDGKYLATAHVDFWDESPNEITVWRIDDQQPIAAMAGPPRKRRVLAWSPDSSLLAGTTKDGKLLVWNALTGEINLTIDTSAEVSSLCWSPKQQLIAAATDDDQIHTWDVNTGELVASCLGHAGKISHLRWSPDGQDLASVGDRSLRIWKPTTGNSLAIVDIETWNVRDLWWSPDGSRITITVNDNSVRTWTLPHDLHIDGTTSNGVPPRDLTTEERQRFGLPFPGTTSP